MAKNAAEVRANYYRNNINYGGYEDGSAVRKLDEYEPQPERRKNKDHSAAMKARARATAIGRGYVLFLAVMCVVSLALCVSYLRQKATITSQYDQIAVLESKYNQLKGDNDAVYNQVISSLTMEKVRDSALALGMHYAGSDQVQYYTLSEDSYVRQYQEVTPGE